MTAYSKARWTVVVGTLSAIACVALVAMVQRRDEKYIGELRLELGQSQWFAVRDSRQASAGDASPREVRQAVVSGSELPLSPNVARNWIDPSETYIVTALPFSLQLDRIETTGEPQYRRCLVVRQGEHETTHPVEIGQTVEIGQESFCIETVRRWSGLLPDPKGHPMFALALADEPGNTVFLRQAEWCRLTPQIAAIGFWHDSERDLQAAVEHIPPAAARWGVVDDSKVQWLTTFLPGSGFNLADGRTVTLLRMEHHGDARTPCLIVEVGNGDEVYVEQVQPDASSGLLRFETMATAKTILALHAWQDDRAHVAVFEAGKKRGARELNAGDEWRVTDSGTILRLLGVLRKAAPVASQDSPFDEMVLGSDSVRLALRENASVNYGDHVLRFEQSVTPAKHSYDLVVLRGQSAESFRTDPGTRHRTGAWILEHEAPDRRTPEVAVLHVYYRRPLSNRVLFILSGLGAVLLTTYIWRRRIQSPV